MYHIFKLKQIKSIWNFSFMVSHTCTVYFKDMMVFTLTMQMYHRISVLVSVLVRVPEYLSTSRSTSTSTMTLELMSTSTVRVPEMQYSSTASTSTEYEYPSPGNNNVVISPKRRRDVKWRYHYVICPLGCYIKNKLLCSSHKQYVKERSWGRQPLGFFVTWVCGQWCVYLMQAWAVECK